MAEILKAVAEDGDMKSLYAADAALDDIADALVGSFVVEFETEEFGHVEVVVRATELEL